MERRLFERKESGTRSIFENFSNHFRVSFLLRENRLLNNIILSLFIKNSAGIDAKNHSMATSVLAVHNLHHLGSDEAETEKLKNGEIID